jgi:hypothetical protein
VDRFLGVEGHPCGVDHFRRTSQRYTANLRSQEATIVTIAALGPPSSESSSFLQSYHAARSSKGTTYLEALSNPSYMTSDVSLLHLTPTDPWGSIYSYRANEIRSGQAYDLTLLASPLLRSMLNALLLRPLTEPPTQQSHLADLVTIRSKLRLPCLASTERALQGGGIVAEEDVALLLRAKGSESFREKLLKLGVSRRDLNHPLVFNQAVRLAVAAQRQDTDQRHRSMELSMDQSMRAASLRSLHVSTPHFAAFAETSGTFLNLRACIGCWVTPSKSGSFDINLTGLRKQPGDREHQPLKLGEKASDCTYGCSEDDGGCLRLWSKDFSRLVEVYGEDEMSWIAKEWVSRARRKTEGLSSGSVEEVEWEKVIRDSEGKVEALGRGEEV